MCHPVTRSLSPTTGDPNPRARGWLRSATGSLVRVPDLLLSDQRAAVHKEEIDALKEIDAQEIQSR
jgi:hypothetical protein